MHDPQPRPEDRPTLAKPGEPGAGGHGPGPRYDQVPPPQAYGPSPYGQVPYGAPGVPGYGVRPKHPSATTAMTLGLVALIGGLFCLLPIAVAPFAWTTGARAVKEIDASGGALDGRSEAQAGYVMGIIGTVLLGLSLVVVVLYLLFFAAIFASFLGFAGASA